MNPSHVFLGDNLIKGVLPKKNPKRYAKISFMITQKCGSTNQKNPLYKLNEINEGSKNTSSKPKKDHDNLEN
jgi:hypothetical protein